MALGSGSNGPVNQKGAVQGRVGEFAASFLLGFLVKIAVVKLGGARSYRNAKPLMVGIIAGELVAALGWMLVGAIYWALAGQTPTPYYITPH